MNLRHIKIGLLIVILMYWMTSCTTYSNPLYEARTAIPIGTLREDAIATLSEKSWYHQECQYNDGRLTDLFFYGSQQYNETFIVIVDYSDSLGGKRRVVQISSLDDYAWHSPYAFCVDEERFAH